MPIEQYANGGIGRVSYLVNDSQTTIEVNPGHTLPTTPTFRMGIDRELMLVTGVEGNVYTVTRGIEGTTPMQHIRNSMAVQAVTAAILAALQASADAAPSYQNYAPHTRPLYCELFWNFCRGRGYTAGQGSGTTTTTDITPPDDTQVTLTSAANLVNGTPFVFRSGTTTQVCVVSSIAGQVVTFYPRAIYNFPNGTEVSPLFTNDTHLTANGYYAFGNWLANITENLALCDYDSLYTYGRMENGTYTDANGVNNVPTGFETILNGGTVVCTASDYDVSQILPNAKWHYGISINPSVVDGGIRTLLDIPVYAGQAIVLSAFVKAVGNGTWRIKVVDKDAPSTILAQTAAAGPRFYDIGTYQGQDSRSLYKRVIPFRVPVGTKLIEVRFLCQHAPTDLYLDNLLLQTPHTDPNFDLALFRKVGTRRIAFMGDSWGVGDAYTRFATALATKLGYTPNLFNASVSGNTLNDMNLRFATDILPYQPAICIAQYGGNDMVGARSQTLMEGDLDTFIDNCRQNGITPVITGIPPVSSVGTNCNSRNEQLFIRACRHGM